MNKPLISSSPEIGFPGNCSFAVKVSRVHSGKTSIHIPPPLQRGDRVRVITPAEALPSVESIAAGVQIWRDQGYQVEFAAGYDGRWGHLAGQDSQREAQLWQALRDPDCRAILCSRGGSGSSRLLERWPWGEPLPPTWLVGFSDITALLWAFGRQGVSAVHGPVLLTLADEPAWSVQRLFQWVEGKAVSPLQGQGWKSGQARGPLIPANLTVATYLLHTPFQPSLTGAILALEDTQEEPHRLDRMLTYWRMSGILQTVAGIALGRFSQCEPRSQPLSLTAIEVLHDRLDDLHIPIVADLPFGHDGVNAALPVGVWAELDGDRGTLTIIEDRQQ